MRYPNRDPKIKRQLENLRKGQFKEKLRRKHQNNIISNPHIAITGARSI